MRLAYLARFSAALLALACVPVLGQRADVERLELPDDHYLRTNCDAVASVPIGLRARPELARGVDLAAVDATVAQIADVCSEGLAGRVPRDDWFERFEGLRTRLESLTDACGRTTRCLKVSLPPRKSIPDHFSAYALLLFTSELPGPREQVRAYFGTLQSAFERLGEAIGDTRAAIVFQRSETVKEPDILRGKNFADRLGLQYNDGPFVIASRKRPDRIAPGDEIVVVKLSGIAPERVVRVLNVLEQDLRRDALTRNRALLFEEIKQRALTLVDRHPTLAAELSKSAIQILTK